MLHAGSTMTTQVRFQDNGSVEATLRYHDSNGSVASTYVYASTGLDPYGKITSVNQVVVGVYDNVTAAFSSGTQFRLFLAPTTALGQSYGQAWGLGGFSRGTAETSDLWVSQQVVKSTYLIQYLRR